VRTDEILQPLSEVLVDRRDGLDQPGVTHKVQKL
jgi:hypothetical protein